MSIFILWWRTGPNRNTKFSLAAEGHRPQEAKLIDALLRSTFSKLDLIILIIHCSVS